MRKIVIFLFLFLIAELAQADTYPAPTLWNCPTTFWTTNGSYNSYSYIYPHPQPVLNITTQIPHIYLKMSRLPQINGAKCTVEPLGRIC
jgi:hypothetical protein